MFKKTSNYIDICMYVFFSPHFQNQIHSNQLRRAELESRNLQERLQVLTNQNKMLHAELQETKRKRAEIECKVSDSRPNKKKS